MIPRILTNLILRKNFMTTPVSRKLISKVAKYQTSRMMSHIISSPLLHLRRNQPQLKRRLLQNLSTPTLTLISLTETEMGTRSMEEIQILMTNL